MKDYILPLILGITGLWAINYALTDKDQRASIPLYLPTLQSTTWGAVIAPLKGADKEAKSLPLSPWQRSPDGTPVLDYQQRFEETYAFFSSKFLTLKNCLIVKTCPYPQKGPKDYDSAVYEDVVANLKTFNSWQSRHYYVDGRISKLMRQLLPMENAYVKIEALKVLSSQSPDPQNLELILHEVVDYYQPEVIAPAMRELARFRTQDARTRIDNAVEEALLRGPLHAASEIAAQIKPLLHSGNRVRYQRILNELQSTPLSRDVEVALQASLN